MMVAGLEPSGMSGGGGGGFGFAALLDVVASRRRPREPVEVLVVLCPFIAG